jgi:predicted Fe-Mo cluster-binding NifX family protein
MLFACLIQNSFGLSRMTDISLKIAVASKEGLAVSEHFGHAKHFRIYQVAPGVCEFLESRDVEHYCHGQHGSESALAGILLTINDCNAVFVARIGDGPAEKLQAIGVTAVADYAYQAVEESLLDYIQRVAKDEDGGL